MTSSYFKLQRPSRLEWTILAVIGGSIISVALYWLVSGFVDSLKTYPLGDGMTYLAKETSGCHIGFTKEGFDFGVCPTRTVYYYATDLDLSGSMRYFHGSFNDTTGYEKEGVGTEPPFWSSQVKNTPWHVEPMYFRKNEVPWNLTYYDNGHAVEHALSRPTTKAHVIRIEATDYPAISKYAL